MQAHAWELVAIALAVILQVAYQYAHASFPDNLSIDVLRRSLFEQITYLGKSVRTTTDGSAEESVDAAVARASFEASLLKRRYRVRSQRGFLNIHDRPGDPYRSDNIVGRWLDGDVVEGLGEGEETEHGPWVQAVQGWSIAFHDGFQFLEPIESSEVLQPAIVLDDNDIGAVGAWEPGVYRPCLVDAYAGMFRHDWGRNKGQMYGEYPFGPLSHGGCYALDEWHPGGMPLCKGYLTSQVHLEVWAAASRVVSFTIDQSEQGGQWNMLGTFELPLGVVGRLHIANNGTAAGCKFERNSGGCFWVSDAFRLRRLGTNCLT